MGRLLTTLVVLFLFASCVCAVFTEHDAARVVDNIVKSQQADGMFGDLKQTHHAVSLLSSLGKEVPKKAVICSKVTLTSASLCDIYHSAAILSALGCRSQVPASVKTELQKGLESGVLMDIFKASQTSIFLKNVDDLNWSEVVKNVMELMEDDGSFRGSTTAEDSSAVNAGIALQVLSSVVTAVPQLQESALPKLREVAARVGDIVDLGGEANADFSAHSRYSGIAATSTVLKGLVQLSSSLSEALQVSDADIARFAKFLLSNKYTATVADADYLVSALKLLSDNNIHVPMFVTVANSAPKSFKIRVTDAMDAALPVNVDVVASLVANVATPSNVVMRDVSFTSTKAPEFELKDSTNAWSKAAPGFYNIRMSATPKTEEDRFKALENVVETVKVTAELALDKFEIFVSDSAKGLTDDVIHKASYPKAVSSKLTASTTKHIHAKVILKGDFVPKQIFIQLKSLSTGKAAMFVATGSGPAFTSRLAVGSTEFLESIHGPGDYEIRVIVGDALLAKGTKWTVGTVTLDVPAAEAKQIDGLGAKPLIKHQFRVPEPRPNMLISYIFTAIVCVPLVALLGGLAFAGLEVQFPSDFQELAQATLFQGSVAGILVLYVWYWLSLTIFQALLGLAIFGGVAVVTGSAALKALHRRSTSSLKKTE